MKPVLLITEGEFGQQVARFANGSSAPVQAVGLEVADGPLSCMEGYGAIGVALARPDSNALQKVDYLSGWLGIRWSAVYLDAQSLWCGPLVIPDSVPCYRCYLRGEPKLRVDLGDPSRIGWDLPSMSDGHPFPAPKIASELLAGDLRDPGGATGRVRRVDLATGRVHTAVVTSDRRCGCGPAVMVLRDEAAWHNVVSW